MEVDTDYEYDAPLMRRRQRSSWPRRQRSPPNGYFRGSRRPQSFRARKQQDYHQYPREYSTGLWEQGGNNDDENSPRRYHTLCSNVWHRVHSAQTRRRSPCMTSPHEGERHSRLVESDGKDAMVDNVEAHQPFSQSNFSQRSRHHHSSSTYQRGRRDFRQKHNHHARDRENYRRSRDMYQDERRAQNHDANDHLEHVLHGSGSSEIVQGRLHAMRDYVKPVVPDYSPKFQTVHIASELKECSVPKGTLAADNVGYLRNLSSKPVEDNEEDELKKMDVMPNESVNHASSSMGNSNANYPFKEGKSHTKDGSPCYFTLMKDNKTICRLQCTNPPIQPFPCWNVEIVKKNSVKCLADLPRFLIFPAFKDTYQKNEWPKFMGYLYTREKIAVVEFERLKIHIIPPDGTKSSETAASGVNFDHAVVAYEVQEAHDTTLGLRHAASVVHGAAIKETSARLKRPKHENETQKFTQPPIVHPDQMVLPRREAVHSTHLGDARAYESDANVKGSNSAEKGTCSSISKCVEAGNSFQHFVKKEGSSTTKNFVRTDPSYLKTLGQAHSGWIFGAIAELVDNSRDANASKLEITLETIYCKAAGCEIPMLAVIDDGDGMNHEEISRMISFGHKQPDERDTNRIGRFGVGFKTGTMRLGRDALVLTQTTKSRSIAFLSQSYNEGKDNVEIPIVSYRRQAQFMELDESVQSEALAKYNLKAIKEFSPFNKYLIGEKAALFKSKTGTQIYIWNLDKWGSDYSLEGQAGMRGSSSFHHGDILIRSRRVRSRPGQTSRQVPLDYSLRCYLEVIFLEPRMKIYVQGSLVKTHPLAKSLNNTAVINGEIMGKPVQLTLGRSQLEWDQANSGVFLYWHGRLIEAYKRVGGMIHSADMGRGVIGVIDVTELMDDENGGVWVLNNKQGFQDCEAYAKLEQWLGNTVDEYWDRHFDALELKKGKARYKPDHEWVQCEKCRKWRILDTGYDSSMLTGDWFCYMEPFCGKCEMPEQKVDHGVITVGTKRFGFSSEAANYGGGQIDNDSSLAKGKSDDDQTRETNVARPILKRLRRGPTPASTKK